MARLSEDDSSWKADGIKHRDNRHDHGSSEVSRKGKKKNTRKWCKGKVGREHEIEVVSWRRSSKYLIERCANCGKEFGFQGTAIDLFRKPE